MEQEHLLVEVFDIMLAEAMAVKKEKTDG